MTSFVVQNNAESTITDALALGALTLNVANGAEFPSAFPFLITIWDEATYPDPSDDNSAEIVRCTGRTANALTIVRGQEGTGDSEHAAGERVAMLITAGHFNDATNGITTKLDGIEALADVTSTHETSHSDVLVDGDIGVTVAAALGADDNYVTDAELVVVQATSGANTGDQILPTDATLEFTDVTTNNVSNTKHGFVPKATDVAGQFLGADGAWGAPSGSGDMTAATYDPTAIADDAFDMSNMVEGTTEKILTATERTKLTGIDEGADVTSDNPPQAHLLGSHTTDTLANLNSVVTDATLIDTTDARLSDARTPTSHNTTHVTGGSDVIADAIAAGNAGLMTGADKTKLNGVESLADVTTTHETSHLDVLVDGDIGVTVAAALGGDENYVSDAELVVVQATSGANTGDNSPNTNYSSLVTNATHTGEVTGDGALTIDNTAISGKALVTAVGSDYVVIGDSSDADNLKKALISDFASAGGDMAAATYDPTTIADDVFDMDNMVEGTTTKILTATERTKLTGIEALADVTASNETSHADVLVDADIGVTVAAVLGADDNYVTDAEKTVIGNTSGANTGDQIASGVPNTPAGDIVATDVQAAVNELDTEKTTITEVKADSDIAKVLSRDVFIDYTDSPMIVTGGEITVGTNAGTFKVAALTALIRKTDSATGELAYVTKTAEDNIAITLSDTQYYVVVNYNGGVPTISIIDTLCAFNDKIPIGSVMKDASDAVHYISGCFRLQGGVAKLHYRAFELYNLYLTSGNVIAYSGTNNFTMTEGVMYEGINRLTQNAYNSATVTFVRVHNDNAGGWTEVAANVIDFAHYDLADGSGNLGNVGTAKYGCHWVYRHAGECGHVYVLYGTDSYSLAEAEVAQVPTGPDHLSQFGCLIGKIIAPQAGGSFSGIQMVTDTVFTGVSVATHNELGGLNDGDYKHLTATEKTLFDTVESGADVTDAVNIASSIVGVADKTSILADSDTFAIIDSQASYSLKEYTYVRLKTYLKDYFDYIYAAVLGADDNYVTDAEKTVIGNTSNTNTGDQTLPIDSTLVFTDNTGNNVSNTKHGYVPKATDVSGDFLGADGAWGTPSGSGDMAAATYDPTSVVGDAFDMDNMVEGTSKILTAAERTLLGNTSNTNTGDQTSIVGITGSKAEFDTAVSDGNITFDGDAPTAHKSAHVTGGSDVIDSAISEGNAGLMTGADKKKLDDIETAADVTDAANIASSIVGTAAKATPVDADTLPLIDSADASSLKEVLWSQVKATLKTYFDTLYNLYSHPNHSGDVTSSGDGATTIEAGAVDIAMHSATGTPGAATFYRGDNTWSAVSGSATYASIAEVNAGTEAAKGNTPDALAGSIFGTKNVVIKCIADDTALTTGDGKTHFTIPIELNGMNLVSVGAHVYTASSSGLPNFQVHNASDGPDMLSTAITIDASENDSKDATTAAVIDAAEDDVTTGDVIRFDCDAAGTGTAGMEIRMSFRLP